MNFKISSKKYHIFTKENARKKKAEKWTRHFVEFERNDRNDRLRYNRMPSPKEDNFRDYITHRIRILKRARDVYTTSKYTRLRFDKYIQSNRVSDKIAAMLVSNHIFLSNLLKKKNFFHCYIIEL